MPDHTFWIVFFLDSQNFDVFHVPSYCFIAFHVSFILKLLKLQLLEFVKLHACKRCSFSLCAWKTHVTLLHELQHPLASLLQTFRIMYSFFEFQRKFGKLLIQLDWLTWTRFQVTIKIIKQLNLNDLGFGNFGLQTIVLVIASDGWTSVTQWELWVETGYWDANATDMGRMCWYRQGRCRRCRRCWHHRRWWHLWHRWSLTNPTDSSGRFVHRKHRSHRQVFCPGQQRLHLCLDVSKRSKRRQKLRLPTICDVGSDSSHSCRWSSGCCSSCSSRAFRAFRCFWALEISPN